MTTLAVLAGSTTRIRLGTSILLAALRRPVVLAKAAATLDVLSGGRLDLGVGVGWQRAEYEAAGLDFGSRGAALDRTLELCSDFWTLAVVERDEADLRFGPTHMMPKPVSPGGVPIWVSGTLNDRVVGRLVRFGRGWIPWGPDAVDAEAAVGAMRRAVDAAGGDADRIEVTWAVPTERGTDGVLDPAATAAPAVALAAVGVTDIRVRLRPSDYARLDLLADLAAAVHDVA